ncbi:hypothetical protein Tco_0382232 [Tanacetum coccineum]
MSMLEDRSNYINVSESAQDTDVGLGEADSETSPKRSRIQKNLLDKVSQLHYPFSLLERLKADNTNLASHLPQSCLILNLEGFPFITVNTREYHSKCSGSYRKDNALESLIPNVV